MMQAICSFTFEKKAGRRAQRAVQIADPIVATLVVAQLVV